MARETVVNVSLRADVKDLTKSLKAAEGITANEARKMVLDVEKGFRALEKEAKKASKAAANATTRAARQTAREWDQQMSNIKGLSGAVFGGVAGDVFDLVEVVEGSSLALAGVGVALGGVAVAGVGLVGVAAGMKALADAALDARTQLEEEGIAVDSLIDPTALAALDDYETAMDDLSDASALAAIQLGSALAPALTDVADALVDIAPAAKTASKALAFGMTAAEWSATFAANMTPANQMVMTLAKGSVLASKAIDDLLGAADREAVAMARNVAEQRDMLHALGLLITEEEQAAIVTERHAEAQKEAANAARVAHATAQRVLRGDIQETRAAVQALNSELALEAEAERKAQIEAGKSAEATRLWNGELRQAQVYGASLVTQMEAMPEAALTFSESMGIAASALQKTSQLTDAFGGAAEAVFANVQTAAERSAQKQVDAIGTLRAANAKLRAEREGATEEELANIQRQLDANNRAIGAREKAKQRANSRARTAFNNSKKTQKAAALVNAAAAATASFAPPPLGAGPIFGAGLAIATGIKTGAEIAAINKQQFAGIFADGGLVGDRVQAPRDHVPIFADPREGIVSPRGMERLGEDGLDAINRGQVPSAPINLTAQLVLDRRVIGEVMATVGGAAAGRRTGRLPPRGGI
ncbi:MAG: hypothetical protein GY913_15295 [Proteobacteria bacterium]|nr:hypothetical protein [Pseudomonadota bacterium]